MKKLFFLTFAMLFISSYCNAINIEKKKSVDKKREAKTEVKSNDYDKKPTSSDFICTISCSETYNGVTYTATAGNWFTSCRSAAVKCTQKLTALMPHNQ